MVSHLNKNQHGTLWSSINLWLKAPEKPTSSSDEFYSLDGCGEGHDLPTLATRLSAGEENVELQLNGGFRKYLVMLYVFFLLLQAR